MIPIHLQADGMTIPVRVTPKAARTGIELFQEGDEMLRIKITTVPEGGKANQAVINLFSKVLSVGKKQISIIQGETNRNKVIKIVTNTPNQIIEDLSKNLGNTPPSVGYFQLLQS